MSTEYPITSQSSSDSSSTTFPNESSSSGRQSSSAVNSSSENLQNVINNNMKISYQSNNQKYGIKKATLNKPISSIKRPNRSFKKRTQESGCYLLRNHLRIIETSEDEATTTSHTIKPIKNLSPEDGQDDEDDAKQRLRNVNFKIYDLKLYD